MRIYLFAILLLVAGACNIMPTTTAPASPTSRAQVAPMNPLARHLEESSAHLIAEIDSITALLSETDDTENQLLSQDMQEKLVGDWSTLSAQFRQKIDSFLRATSATDSIRKAHIEEVDSLATIVSSQKRGLLEALRMAEIGGIDAKILNGTSFKFQGGRFSAIKVDPNILKVHLHWKNQAGEKYMNIGNLKEDLEKNGERVVMITNAGMYNPDNSPQGLFVEKGKQYVALDTSQGPAGKTLNFYLKPNGVFFLDNNGPKIVVTEKFPKSQKGIQFATQSGPMLLIDEQIHPKFTKGSANTNIRSGVGITRDHQIVFAISDKPVNFYDFAVLFKDALHCTDALYLDGAISLMYLPNSKRLNLGGDFGPILAVTAKK